jgi:UDP-2-acetamido-2,6-beta-L-arabino-hexul-4-ose reductase
MTERVAVTGANGFLGRNLVQRLRERGFEVRCVPHTANGGELRALLADVRIVFHLAGVNRPEDVSGFAAGNEGFTRTVCDALVALGQSTPLVYASSIQAGLDNPYGRSKHAAEIIVADYARTAAASTFVFRLPNVFGKWGRRDYNSVVATFCYNIARGLPITIDDPAVPLNLVYVDDVIEKFMAIADELPAQGNDNCTVAPVYQTTVGEVAEHLRAFHRSRETLVASRVGTGFIRALHATYTSYLAPADFAYPLVAHTDARGVFVEMMRTPDCGQFSFFTAHPGVTRGSHYHHSKTEKFLVVEGRARFRFRHLLTNETFEILVSSDEPVIVETVPGWIHDITNTGDSKMVAILWANEVFDKNRPDTIAAKV